MISDITLGQFFPGSSPLHRLDPRSKILLSLLYIVAIFVANTVIAFVTLIFVTVLLMAISGISFGVMLRGIKPIVFILVFTSLLNLFLTTGEGEPLLSFYFIKIYEEGIVRAVFMTLRVIVLIIGSSLLLTYTTSPIALTDGIEGLLSPLKKIKLPVHAFAMMMSIALRFIPTLIEETEKIMNAQRSRGADFTSGGLIKRARSLIPLLVPLFMSSFKRADELATAMECRCYRGDKNRTKLVKLEYKPLDFLWLGLFALLLGAMIFSRYLPDLTAGMGLIFDIAFYQI